MSHRRCRWWSLVAVTAVGFACAQQQPAPPKAAPAAAPSLAKVAPATPDGPPVTLLPAATARSLELAAISITSVDRLLTNGAKLVARAVPLPIDPAGLRDMLLTQAGLSPDVAANLDLASPSGAAVVALGKPGASGLVMAVAARGPAEAERVIGALGKKVMKRGAVVLIDNGNGGRGWVFRAGNVVVLSDDIDALARGAMLALEARHAAADDVTAVLYPDAIARSHGTDVKTALATVVAAVRAAQEQQAAEEAAAQQAATAPGKGTGKGKATAKANAKESGTPAPAGTAAGGAPGSDQSLAAFTQMLELLADAQTVELGLAADDARGVVLRARLHARAGSGLAAVAQAKQPFDLDPAVLAGTAGAPPAMLGAMSYGPMINKMMAQQRERLAGSKDKGAPAALAVMDAMLAAMAGQTSAAATFAREPPHLSAEITYPLKDAASAGKLAAALGRLDRQATLALWQAQVGPQTMVDFALKRESVGKVKALRYTLTPRKGGPLASEFSKLLGKGLDAYVAVAGTRLVVTMGRDAKARLAALTAPKTPPAAAPPPGAIADALASAKGRDGFFFLDVAPLLTLAGSYAEDPRMALLAQGSAGTPIPVYGTSGGDGGNAWTVDLTVPPAAFTGAGAVIQKMGAAAPSGAGK